MANGPATIPETARAVSRLVKPKGSRTANERRLQVRGTGTRGMGHNPVKLTPWGAVGSGSMARICQRWAGGMSSGSSNWRQTAHQRP